MVDDQATYRARGDCISAEVDEEAVVLNSQSGIYFGINPTGLFIWTQLGRDGGTCVKEAAASLVAEFGTPNDVALGDARDFIQTLLKEGLIELVT